MNLQLDSRVKAVLDEIVAHTPAAGLTPSGDVVPRAPLPRRNGGRLLAVAVALVAVIGLGALVTVQRRPADAPAGANPPGSQRAVPDSTTPEDPNLLGDQLATALGLDARVFIVNASTNPGLADSLRDALMLSGYGAVEAADAASGTALDRSTMYTAPGVALSIPNVLGRALELAWEDGAPPSEIVTSEMSNGAAVVLVLGNDLADAPWQDTAAPLVDPGIGRLVIIDATSSELGHQRVGAGAETLRAAGVDVAAILPGTRTVEDTMLMPIGDSSAWTFAVAELAGVGGFDTWSPDLVDDALPDDVSAALVIGDDPTELGASVVTALPNGPISALEVLQTGESVVVVDDGDIKIVGRYEPTTTAPYCVDLSLGGVTGPACGDRQAWTSPSTFAISSGDGTRQLVGQIVPDTVTSVSTSDGRTIIPVSNVWWDVAPTDSPITYVVHAADGHSTEPFAAVAE